MSWTDIFGHADLEQRFRSAAARNRLPSTFLFVGPDGIGKRKFALQFAKSLLCERHEEGELQSCDHCPACMQVANDSHPDLIQIRKPKDGNNLPLGLFIGGDKFGHGLLYDISLKPFRGGRKIAIIDDADFLSHESPNALLKTLEEPPPNSILILIGTSPYYQRPTILSRSQIIRFRPLSVEQVRTILSKMEIEAESDVLDKIASASRGSVRSAMMLAEPDVYAFRESLFRQLASLRPIQGDFQKDVTVFAGNKEIEAAEKRERLRVVADWVIEFYEQVSRLLNGQPPQGDSIVKDSVEAAARRWNAPLSCLSRSIERTLELYQQIDAFVSPANMIDPWLADLSELAAGKMPAVIDC